MTSDVSEKSDPPQRTGTYPPAIVPKVTQRPVIERMCVSVSTGRAAVLRLGSMCRNIKILYNFAPPTSPDEVEAAALQFVRKVSGMTKPSKANEAVFAAAVAEVTAATSRLLDGLVTTAAPRDREVEAEKHRARSAARFA